MIRRHLIKLWDGATAQSINAARLSPQGPSRELPRHRAAACVTELQLHRLRVRLSAVGADSYALE